MIVYINIVCFFLNWFISPTNNTVQIPNVKSHPPGISAGFLSNWWFSAARLRSAGESNIGNCLGQIVDLNWLPIVQPVLVGGALLVSWGFACSAQERFQDQNQNPWFPVLLDNYLATTRVAPKPRVSLQSDRHPSSLCYKDRGESSSSRRLGLILGQMKCEQPKTQKRRRKQQMRSASSFSFSLFLWMLLVCCCTSRKQRFWGNGTQRTVFFPMVKKNRKMGLLYFFECQNDSCKSSFYFF